MSRDQGKAYFQTAYNYEHGINGFEVDKSLAEIFYEKAKQYGYDSNANSSSENLDSSEASGHVESPKLNIKTKNPKKKTDKDVSSQAGFVDYSDLPAVERYVREKIDELASKNGVYIVNVGSMNNGKSSLFNSLADKEVFEVADIRCTKKVDKVEFAPDVYLLDTPGLGAENSDDNEAFNAYKSANMIMFVHSLKTGELRKQEIESIAAVQKNYPDQNYFWKHFVLVLTFMESAADEEERKEIVAKIKKDMIKQFGPRNFEIFEVSNSRYLKGKSTNKPVLMEKSGIPELKKYVDNHLETLKLESEKLLQDEVEMIKSDAIKNMQAKRDAIQKDVTKKQHACTRRYDELSNRIVDIYDNLIEGKEKLSLLVNRTDSLKKEITNLKRQHTMEKNRYRD